MSQDFVAWATSGLKPDPLICPLPSLSQLRGGAWPVLALAEPLAATLRSQGMTYSRKSGFAQYDAPLTDFEVTRQAALQLRIAADYLRDDDPVEMLEAEIETDEAIAERLAGTTAGELAARQAERFRDLLNDREYINRSNYAAVHANRWTAHSEALKASADRLTASENGQRALLRALRQLLSAPSSERVSEAMASGWIATFDQEDRLGRPDLTRRYREAGAPGNVRDSRLRELARERWGDPVKIRGSYFYRPARAVPEAGGTQ